MAISLVILGWYYNKYVSYDLHVPPDAMYEWIPFSFHCIYITGFSIGLGPIPWIMIGELFPEKSRGTATSLVATFKFACSFVVMFTYKFIENSWKIHVVFWIYSAFAVTAFLCTIFVFPKTRKYKPENIEDIKKNPTRKINARANFNIFL